MALKIYTGARGSRFVCDDTKGFGDAVALVSVRADAPITSCAREVAAEPLLAQIGKMSQAQLFACSQKCTAGCHGNCNPANPPGKSTHERRNDGVAYPRWVVAFRLPYWARGIDVQRDRVAAFCEEARKQGWSVTLTYPGSPAESQHVNLRKRPKISLWRVRPLRAGASGPRASEVILRLRRVMDPQTRHPYLDGSRTNGKLTSRVEVAIKAFQRDHGQKGDGVVGSQTIRALRAADRRPPASLDRGGLDFIEKHEGVVLYAYNDPVGFATFGAGHLLGRRPVNSSDRAKYGTKENRKPVPEMRALADELLRADAERFEKSVLTHVPARWRRSQDRFNAFVSIAFNLGEEVLTASPPLTSLGEALRGRSVKKVTAAFLLYNKAGNPPRSVAGLTTRRNDEARLIRRNQ